MSIVFVGGEMGAFVPADSSATETTAATHLWSSSFSRCALRAGSSSYNEGAAFTGQTDFWVHANLGNLAYSSGTTDLFVLVSGAAVDSLRATFNRGSSSLQLQYWNGAAWTNAGSAITIDMEGQSHDIDLHCVVNSGSGSMTLYVAGTSRIAATGLSLAGTASIAKLRCDGANFPPYISQVIIADESTIGWRLKTCPATGAGATADWTGTYTEVDETVYSDADFINSSTNDQVELFTHSTTIPTGYTVRGFGVTARAKRGSSGPANLQLALRSGGTTYYSGSKALDLGYGAFVHIWDTDPATSANFTTSAAQLAQFGVRAKT